MPIVADFDDTELLHRARVLLASGQAPPTNLAGIWGGLGRNEPCSICELPIKPEQIGFDLLFRAADSELELHMHARCRSAWDRAAQQET